MDAVVSQVKAECLQLLRSMNLPEIDAASIEHDFRPGLSTEIGNGTFNGVYRVRAVQGALHNQEQGNNSLRLGEDLGIKIAAVKVPHTSRVRDFMIGLASRRTTYEHKINKILRYYRRECTIWAKIAADARRAEENHLLRFYGFMERYDFNLMPALVAKYYPLGDARSYIDQNVQPRLSDKQKLFLIGDIAKALEFLHAACGVAHRDVKGTNILLESGGDRLIGILGDFGAAKEFTVDTPWFLSSSESGGDNWCPPEYKRPRGFHDDKGPGDIWSLGCTMLELLQEEDPWYQVSLGDIPTRIAAYDHPPKGPKVSQEHYDFSIACWTRENERPTAAEMHERIQQLAADCST